MGSLLRRVKERKKTRRLGEVEVMEQEGYGELEVDSKGRDDSAHWCLSA